MEDLNMLGADCVVISCCCQCLILQILVFVLLRLPCKLVTKTREYAKKLRPRRRNKKTKHREIGSYKEELLRIYEQSYRIEAERAIKDAEHSCGSCMEEVEKVMKLYQKETAFGSFWGREETCGIPTTVTFNNDDDSVVRYEIIEMLGSFSYT